MGNQAFVTAIKNNAPQLKSRAKFKGLGSEGDIYKGGIKEKEFSPAQIQAARDAFELQNKVDKRKTFITLVITIIAVPIIIYGMTQLYLYAFT